MQSEFNKGAAYMRDITIASIIGKQNANGNNEESGEYKALQSLLVAIEENYGRYGKEFKG